MWCQRSGLKLVTTPAKAHRMTDDEIRRDALTPIIFIPFFCPCFSFFILGHQPRVERFKLPGKLSALSTCSYNESRLLPLYYTLHLLLKHAFYNIIAES